MVGRDFGPAFAPLTGVFPPLPCFALFGLATLAACSPYRAGSFQGPTSAFPSERATRGCVDVAVSATLDPVAEGPVLDLYLGNRCRDAVWVDIPRLAMSVYIDEGEELPVAIYDPGEELRPSLLGGKEQVHVRLELEAPAESLRVCAQLDGLASTREPGPPQVLCTPVEDRT